MPLGRFTVLHAGRLGPLGARPRARGTRAGRGLDVGAQGLRVRRLRTPRRAGARARRATPSCAAGGGHAARGPGRAMRQAETRLTLRQTSCSASCRAPPSCCRSPPRRHTDPDPVARRPAVRASSTAELRKSFEVALHAGAGAAPRDRHAQGAAAQAARGPRPAPRGRDRRSRWRPPALAGYALEPADRAASRRAALDRRRALAGGRESPMALGPTGGAARRASRESACRRRRMTRAARRRLGARDRTSAGADPRGVPVTEPPSRRPAGGGVRARVTRRRSPGTRDCR